MKMLTMTIYADQTGLFTDEEIMNDNLVDFEFPDNILRKWYEEQGLANDTARELRKPIEKVTFEDWFYEASYADDADGLYDFSVKNGYVPKLGINRHAYVFYRDEDNFKYIVFEGMVDECREFGKENSWKWKDYELEIKELV